jgi:hypothetical protein
VDVNIYQKLSVVLGISLFLPLAWQILRGKAKQNMATFILWGSLDGIATGSIFLQHGSYQLPATYTAGSIIVILCILRSRTIEWTWFESFMSVLVFACIIGWSLSGPYLATVMSTVAVTLAGFPQLKDSWKSPKQFPTVIYCGYSVANLLGTIGAKSWSIEERLYPVSALVICVLMVLASLRKYRSRPHLLL